MIRGSFSLSLLMRLVLLAWFGVVCACQSTPSVSSVLPSSFTADARIQSEPVIRVRVMRQQSSIDISAEGNARLRVRAAGTSPETAAVYSRSVFVEPRQGRWFFSQGQGASAMTLRTSTLIVEAENGEPLQTQWGIYPGQLVLELDSDLRTFDVINRLPMEQYLPGVLDGELYKKWHPQAYASVAIAARTYAMVQMEKHVEDKFDVESTVASQAYNGLVSHTVAVSAVNSTRGKVLTWRKQIFPAYYSSACGGTGQDAAAAFVGAANIPPLLGRYHGGCCADSPHYRWNPVVMDRYVLARRLVSWGRANRHAISGLTRIADIRITRTNSAGRPTEFSIDDAAGRTYLMGPEQFRHAVNYTGGGMAALAAEQTIKSSHVEVAVVGNQVRFTQGRGFGHGVGLCQWGTQRLAVSGYSYSAILDFYYPGAVILKVY